MEETKGEKWVVVVPSLIVPVVMFNASFGSPNEILNLLHSSVRIVFICKVYKWQRWKHSGLRVSDPFLDGAAFIKIFVRFAGNGIWRQYQIYRLSGGRFS
jgi:hypothetical protein